MKINSLTILSFLSLVASSVARPKRAKDYGYDDPIDQNSQVTAFVNTDEGLKVECWEIGDFLPESHVTRADGSKGAVRSKKLAGNIEITLFSFAPSVTIFSFGATEVHNSAVDFRAKPNLFTVKDGLIFIEAINASGDEDYAAAKAESQYVFADVNGDDWFYFEDSTSDSSKEQCAKEAASSHFQVRTISGSDTTLVNFQYQSTPRHKVLHEGRCNFAGLLPVSDSDKSNPDSRKSRFRSQNL